MNKVLSFVLILMSVVWGAGAQASLFERYYTTNERDSGQRTFNSVQEHLEKILSSGDIVGNGGGYAEQNFSYLYDKLGEIYSYCLIASECSRSQASKNILLAIQKAWVMRKSGEYSHRFLARQVFNSFFPDAVSLFSTGYYFNSMVYFDEAGLYDERIVDDYHKIVTLWTLVLAKQAGIKDGYLLRKMAKRIPEYYFRIKNELRFKFADNQISIWQMKPEFVKNAPSFGLLLNINGRFINVLFDYSCRKGTPLTQFTFSDLAWNNPVWGDEYVSIELVGNASVVCSQPNSGSLERTRFVTSFGFKVQPDSSITLTKTETVFDPIEYP